MYTLLSKAGVLTAASQVIAYSWEWVLSHESINPVYDKLGNCVRPEAAEDMRAVASKSPSTKVSPAFCSFRLSYLSVGTE